MRGRLSEQHVNMHQLHNSVLLYTLSAGTLHQLVAIEETATALCSKGVRVLEGTENRQLYCQPGR